MDLDLEDVEHLRGGRPADTLDGDRLPWLVQGRIKLGVYRGDELLEELALLLEAFRLATLSCWAGPSPVPR